MTALTENRLRREEAAMPWEAIAVVETRATSFSFAPCWRPSINAYRCQSHFVIFVDLAGVPPESIVLTVEARRLVVRGSRPAPEPCDEQAQLLALEIDHGAFERRIDLPASVQPEALVSEYRDGLLRVQLPLVP